MKLGNRYSQHSFAQVPDIQTGRSKFDRSFTVKDTFNFDYLVPVFTDEILPGDTANVTVNCFARLSSQALKAPVMDNMYIDWFFFFVPSRLVWENWERFNGAQDNPGDSTDFILPSITAPAVGGFTIGSIYDHMGLPTGINSLKINNALPLRCYNKIFNDWFRDQNMQDSVDVPFDDGPDVPADYTLLKRGRRHDYFTSSLPWPQKGPAVELPLGVSAPVLGLGNGGSNYDIGATPVRESNGQSRTYPFVMNAGASSVFYMEGTAATNGYPKVLADLSEATAATINQLREAFAMQSLFELDARGGTRYVEILRAHFNVTSPDFRLQRAEYLGGGQTRFNSHPVSQTAPSTDESAMGSLAAFGTASTHGRNIGFTKSFQEHGYVIGLAAARADITYQQGLNRFWDRSTRYDFFWPKLQELGEQAVLNKEIYAQGTSADEQVFGYQERFAEYRYMPSSIRGEFKSMAPESLDYFHMADEFASLPQLNSEFIESNTPIERALAVDTNSQILMDMFFSYKHARPMVARPTPATLGRF